MIQISDNEEGRVIPLSKRRRHPTTTSGQQDTAAEQAGTDGTKGQEAAPKEEEEEEDEDTGNSPELTEPKDIAALQGLMIEAIVKSGGVASVDTIQKHVAKVSHNEAVKPVVSVGQVCARKIPVLLQALITKRLSSRR